MNAGTDHGWLSLVPPLAAIVLSIFARQVLVALFVGVVLGAWILNGDPLSGLLRAVDHYGVNAIADAGHASILIFSLCLGGMLGVVGRSGGAAGLASVMARSAKTTRSGLFHTLFLGLGIFFDDYASAILVGTTMRPLTDKLRVSREKLAYFACTTSAPVASVAIVSSWIGVQVGNISEQFKLLGIKQDAYLTLLDTLPYRFYPVLAVVFAFLLTGFRRDFGPMRRAELRARATGELSSPSAAASDEFAASHGLGDAKPRWINAAVPVLVLIGVSIFGMIYTGYHKLGADVPVTARAVLAACDATTSLLWGAYLGGVAALAMATATRALSFSDAVTAWVTGMKSVMFAVTILVLAWSIGRVCKDLGTANFVVSAIGSNISPGVLPAVVFVVAAFISFATGTSWGTMAILFPLVVPLAHHLVPGDVGYLTGPIAAVLSGAVWGNHASPLADTMILSSMSASSDHVDHVRTQMPYALVVSGVTVVVGELATGLGLYPAWVGMILGAVVLAAIVRLVGRPVADYTPQSPATAANHS